MNGRPALQPTSGAGAVDPELLGAQRKAVLFASHKQARPLLNGLFFAGKPAGESRGHG